MDEETLDKDGLEAWEAKALDDENQPDFYDTLEVITLKDSINKVAKAAIVVNVLAGLSMFQWFHSLVASYFFGHQDFAPLIYLITFIVAALSIALEIAIIYFPLKALAHILRILMEMEFRSRKGV